MKIGIDFGTCFSKIAILDNGRPSLEYVEKSVDGIPSLFSNTTGIPRYGTECLGLIDYRNDNDVVRYMKDKLMNNRDLLNGKEKILSGGKEFNIKEIVNGYLTYLVNKAKRDAEELKYPGTTEIEEVTISSPVNSAEGACVYHNYLKETMMDITKLPEDKVHVIDEPEAVAIAYLNDMKDNVMSMSGQTLFIFDLGGGTLDTTIIKKCRNNEWEVLAKSGDPNLGGKDWDDVLYEKLVGNRCVEDCKINKLREEIIDWKETLSTSNNVEVYFPNNSGGDLLGGIGSVTREMFEDWSEGLLNRARGVVHDTLSQFSRQFNKDVGDIHGVVVVGGASNMPQITKMLCDIFGNNKVKKYNPIYAVCLGDAIQNGIDRSISAYSYSLQSKDDKNNDVFWTLIFKGQSFDKDGKIQKTVDTMPHNENDRYVHYHIYESNMMECDFGEIVKITDIDKSNREKICGLDAVIPIETNASGTFKCELQLTLKKDGIVDMLIKHEGKEVGHKIVGGK